MANEQNLKPTSERSKDEAREISRKGGIASGKKRREIKTVREYARALMNSSIKDKSGNEFVFKDALIQKLGKAAFNSLDLAAIKFLIEIIGEAPAQQLEVTGKGGKPLLPGSDMNRKELIAEIKRLQKNRKNK
jgi:general stress protein YciG